MCEARLDSHNHFHASRNLNAIFGKFKVLDEPLGRCETCQTEDLYLVKCLHFASE